MEKYLVIGDPVGHSRSPGMQNAAFEKAGLGAPYGIKRVTPEELPEFFEYARKNCRGVNLTVPHKLAAAELADELTPCAAACKSVNTLLIENGKITGHSTDGIGLEEALKYCFNEPLSGKRIVFLGSGGAAQATAVHLANCNVAGISFINRTLSKAEVLADMCRAQKGDLEISCVAPDDRRAVAGLLEECDYLIQATSLGLKPSDPLPVAPECFQKGMKFCLFDTIYHPTPIQALAEKNGIRWANGKEMLIRQGAASFEMWTGIEPDLSAMRRGFDEGVPGK